MFRTEKQYQEACDELIRQAKEGILPSHSVADAMLCNIIEMWKSDWWKQKRVNEIRRVD